MLLVRVTDVRISRTLGKDPKRSIFKPNLKFNMFLNERLNMVMHSTGIFTEHQLHVRC